MRAIAVRTGECIEGRIETGVGDEECADGLRAPG